MTHIGSQAEQGAEPIKSPSPVSYNKIGVWGTRRIENPGPKGQKRAKDPLLPQTVKGLQTPSVPLLTVSARANLHPREVNFQRQSLKKGGPWLSIA
ncbi:hypothetical protein AOP6_1188 [Desulfuromonas sp. AOP6]|nr:hypothetical protein AOP6_1188 [Desulfuromonas sp. AOP6]